VPWKERPENLMELHSQHSYVIRFLSGYSFTFPRQQGKKQISFEICSVSLFPGSTFFSME
jgi:hypothetical protein